MAQNTVGWPRFGLTDSYTKLKFAEPLQSEGNLSYLEFISTVKSLWEQSFPNFPIKSSSPSDPSFTWFNPNYVDPSTGQTTGRMEDTPAIITYSLELRKAHSVEPKARMRQITSGNIYIYGQRFQNIIAFHALAPSGNRSGANTNTRIDDQDNAYVVESLIETFEDFMMEFTPIFKKIGASELIYSRRLADSEVNRESKDIHKRTVTYMLTTEKTFAARAEVIEQIAVDVRTGMAYEPELLVQATPNYDNISINIIDLQQGATPGFN